LDHDSQLTPIGTLAEAVEQQRNAPRVLVAEDNPVFQTMLCSMLGKWGYETVLARDGQQAWDALQLPDAPRLAILDWMMPGVDGVEVCRRIRATAREPYVYVLLLTARTESNDLVEAMDAGADDYLTKPFNAHELRVRLRAGRRILELQAELMEAREALRIQATHDGLTGLLNRNSILEVLDRELARAARERQPLSLLLIDLDRFKLINDNHGHIAGDVVLRESAARMLSAVRSYDSVGRYGGEEFLVVLPGCSPENAWLQADRVRVAVGGTPFPDGMAVTCSIGIASRVNAAPSDAAALVFEADVALYDAKGRGRNRVEFFAGEPAPSLERTKETTAEVT